MIFSTIVIPMADLRAQLARIKSDVEAAMTRVIASGDYALGPEVAALEDEFASVCGTTHAVGVNSGTNAIQLALQATGVGPGDEVITTPYTFLGTAAAIVAAGARPVFVDVDPETFTLDPARLEPARTDRTRAIVPVHLFGQPADMDPIIAFAARHRLVVVEDACQAHGATYQGRPVGGLGDCGCFSFYPTKNLAACGEGGMVVTRDAGLAGRLRELRAWGDDPRSGNYRLDAIQAALLRVKLPHLAAWNEARRAIAAAYDARLDGASVTRPARRSDREHVFHVYGIRCPDRDAVRAALGERGIASAIHYPHPLHRLRRFGVPPAGAGACPVSDRLAREELSLPIYPELRDTQVAAVADAVRAAVPTGSLS